MSRIVLPSQESQEDKKSSEENLKRQATPEEKKLATLVALAFLILVLGWIATWRWTYSTDSSGAGSFFGKIYESIQPGFKDIGENVDQFRQ